MLERLPARETDGRALPRESSGRGEHFPQRDPSAQHASCVLTRAPRPREQMGHSIAVELRPELRERWFAPPPPPYLFPYRSPYCIPVAPRV